MSFLLLQLPLPGGACSFLTLVPKHLKAPRCLALEPCGPSSYVKAGCFLVSVTAVIQPLRLLVLESVFVEVLENWKPGMQVRFLPVPSSSGSAWAHWLEFRARWSESLCEYADHRALSMDPVFPK